MSVEDVTNPGLVNVADQGYDGLPEYIAAANGQEEPVSIAPVSFRGDDGDEQRPVSVDQAVTTGPATTAVDNRSGAAGGGPGAISVDQPVTVTPPTTALRNVSGGSFQPGNSNITNTTQNNVAGQTFSQGLPENVFV